MFYPSDYTATAFYLGYRPLFPVPRRVPVKAFRKRHTERIPEKRAHRDNPADGMEPADGLSASTGIPPSRQGNAGQGEPRLPRRLNTHAPPRPKQRLASRHDSAAQRQPVLDGPPRLPRLHTTEMTNGPIGFIVRERSAPSSPLFLRENAQKVIRNTAGRNPMLPTREPFGSSLSQKQKSPLPEIVPTGVKS